MGHYVVTIQRQFGSMGRPIARKMSEILGIDFYDRDIVEAAAKQLDLPVSVVKKEEERAHTQYPNPFSRMCFPGLRSQRHAGELPYLHLCPV